MIHLISKRKQNHIALHNQIKVHFRRFAINSAFTNRIGRDMCIDGRGVIIMSVYDFGDSLRSITIQQYKTDVGFRT